MAEPVKRDEALAAAVREAFQRHMENARLAAQALKDKQAETQASRLAAVPAPPSASRDLRLRVPEPANERGTTPTLPVSRVPVRPALAIERSTGASIERLVALASTPKPAEARTEPTQAEPAPTDTKPSELKLVEIKTKPIEPKPTEAKAPVPIDEPLAKPANVRAPDPNIQLAPKPEEAGTQVDSPMDFGEALFIEISPELDRKGEDEVPRLPKAASLPGPLDVKADLPPDEEGVRQHPSRERPRLAQVATSDEVEVAHTKPAVRLETAAAAPISLAPARPQSRFGANAATGAGKPAPSQTALANEAIFGKKSAIRRPIRIPAALMISVLVGGAIAAVGGFAWTNQDKIQGLVALLAPPAPKLPETKVAVVSPPLAAPVPAPPSTPVAMPARPFSSAAPIQSSSAVRSVTTVAITLDEVDEAIQNARELAASGDVDGARAALESYKTGSDARALFALAETYDPAMVHDASKADPAQAKAYYEAAAKAGSQDTADRIARLQLAHAN
jgi:hypothetical protein